MKMQRLALPILFFCLALVLAVAALYLTIERWPILTGAGLFAATLLVYRGVYLIRRLPKTPAQQEKTLLYIGELDESLSAWLDELHYRVETPDTETSIAACVTAHSPRLVCIDALEIEAADMAATTQQIREAARTQPTPLAIVALSPPFGLMEGLRLGCDDVWPHPSDKNELEKRLLSWQNTLDMQTNDQRETPAAEFSPVDAALALRRSNNNRGLATELFEMLIQKLPQDLAHIETLYRTQNRPALTDAVHQLLGGTRYCGLPQLGESCEQLEKLLLDEGSSQAQLGAQLQRLIESAQHLLQWQQDNNFEQCLAS